MFEIRIFANPSGYAELRLNRDNKIFSQDIVERLNFDAEDPALCNGAYSILFAKDVYVLTYHFNVSADAQFRGKRVHVAIAVMRGAVIRDVYTVFDRLKSRFQELACMYKGSSIASAVLNESQSFRDIVKGSISYDDYQLVINRHETKKGVILYDTHEQLCSLLETPNRSDFTGYSQIVFLPRAEAQTILPFIKGSYSVVSISNYAYIPLYELQFPDGHITIAHSEDDVINYTCNVPNYKPRTFEGCLKDRYQEWQIEKSSDGTRFIIPISVLEPTMKEYKVLFIAFKSGKTINPTLGKIDFSGIGSYDENTKTLILSGANIEWASNPVRLPHWSTSDYRIVRVEADRLSENELRVFLMRNYDYYQVLHKHYENYRSSVGNLAAIYLRYDGNDLQFNPDASPDDYRKPYDPKDVRIVYGETPQYRAVEVRYDSERQNFPYPVMREKPLKKISVTIRNRELQPRDIWFGHAYGDDKIEFERVCRLPFEIDWKPGKNLRIRVEASGYSIYEKEYENIPEDEQINIDLNKTIFNRLLLPSVVFVSALLVLSVGVWCGLEYEKNLSSKQEHQYDRKIYDLNQEIDSLKSIIKSDKAIINELKTQIESKSAQNQAEKAKKQARINELKALFNTADFTQADIDVYNSLIGKEDDYSRAARYCLEIINVRNIAERKTIAVPGSALNDKIKYINKYTLHGFYDKLMGNKPYDGNQWQTAYILTEPPTAGFKTVGAAYAAYKKKM